MWHQDIPRGQQKSAPGVARRGLGSQSWSVKETSSPEEEEEAPERAASRSEGTTRNGKGSEEHLRVPGLRGSCKWREIKARWAAWRQVEKGCVDCAQSQDLSLCPMMNHGSVRTGFLLWVIVLVWCGRRDIGNEVRALLRRLLNPEKRW